MMTNLNDGEIQMLLMALKIMKQELNDQVDRLAARLIDANSGLKVDGTPKKRPGRPLGRKNNKKPVVKKVVPVLKEAA